MDIFCEIAKGRSKAFIIYEDSDIMAFLDIEPESKGHTLIIPKKHYKSIEDIDPQIAAKIMKKSIEVGKIIKKKFHFDGIVLKHFSGPKLQDVQHFHLHVIGKNAAKEAFYYATFKNDAERERDLKKISLIMKRALE